ncbi:DUF6339 family protein [Paenibacillus anseongense]|uniref:DUF6339 family protein n=1 Tax=Paenibacillus anseongense TaxID=2682845 RepID=UPI002DBBB5B0|nr:DUF6339 family protein [Paenibacillus anseongense]MEC0269717.1 DUF6339 family protein [Paenibacillus anseongense]
MNLEYIDIEYLNDLKVNIQSNLEYYKSDESWLDSYFEGQEWIRQTKIRAHEVDLQLPQTTTMHFDYENSKRLYTAFKGLTITQATDERLWVYLTHKTFWKYMRKRWSVESYIEKGSAVDVIRERYFFMGNRDRALIRNGIARLWWYGYVSYDDTREDPFELTRMLLSKLDIAQSLLERTFSRNPLITKSILSVLVNLEKSNGSFPDREQFRSLMMHMNQLGGVTILDSYERPELEALVTGKLEKIAK